MFLDYSITFYYIRDISKRLQAPCSRVDWQAAADSFTYLSAFFRCQRLSTCRCYYHSFFPLTTLNVFTCGHGMKERVNVLKYRKKSKNVKPWYETLIFFSYMNLRSIHNIVNLLY